MGKEYRLIEGIGQYWNKRWEVQEKYSYYEDDKKVGFALYFTNF